MTTNKTGRIATFCALLGLAGVPARAEVCLRIDEARDTLTVQERSAALTVASRQFEQAGEEVVAAPCAEEYLLSHVALGRSITVVLRGPKATREATAIGLEDLPAVYNQMVRSLLTGQPMTLSGVVDRTNVSAVQTASARVGADSVFYARLGYTGIFGHQTVGVPSVTLLGYRHELDTLAIDVSFLTFQMKGAGSYYDTNGAATGTWLKLEALHFQQAHANQSAYYGGGLSLTNASLTTGNQSWNGGGLQGEVTAGYEVGRASALRIFFQADAGLPFYKLTSNSYLYDQFYRVIPVAQRSTWAPTLTFSLGLGWQRSKH